MIDSIGNYIFTITNFLIILLKIVVINIYYEYFNVDVKLFYRLFYIYIICIL